jgi:hypothetical protein
MWPQFDVADTDASGQISFDKFSRSSHVLSPALALLVADKRSHSGDASTADEIFEEDEPQEADSKLGYPCTSAHVARHRTARHGRMHVEHATSGVQYTVLACNLQHATCTYAQHAPVRCLSRCRRNAIQHVATGGNAGQLIATQHTGPILQPVHFGAGPLAMAETANKPASRWPEDAVSTRLYCWLCRRLAAEMHGCVRFSTTSTRTRTVDCLPPSCISW